MSTLHLLYTANLRGDLRLLPRLATFMRQLKLALPEARTLQLDLGGSCAPEVWHCAATAGRSMLLGLDAMGYDAAHTDVLVDEASRERLKANLLGLALVDAAHPWEDDRLRLATSGLPDTNRLTIRLDPSESIYLSGRVLRLSVLQAGQIGSVVIDNLPDAPTISSIVIYDLPPGTLPDPTISAAVEFIVSEAQRYQRRASAAE